MGTGLSGNIFCVVANLNNINANSIWLKIEYPILIKKSIEIIYIITGGPWHEKFHNEF